MKEKFWVACLTFSCLLANVQSETTIIERKDFSSIFSFAEAETLFIFDLDNTLMETVQELGSNQWFHHSLQKLINQGEAPITALEKTMNRWFQIMMKTEMRLVDPTAANLLKQKQFQGVSMIALTKRPPFLADRSLEQLSSLGIDFSKACSIRGEMNFPSFGNSLYKQGVLFISLEWEKGPILVAFLQCMEKMPKRIVYVDDQKSHIEGLAKALIPLNIPFVGIRYGGADDRVKGFNPQIAETQWKQFGKILSDDQASQLIEKRKGVTPNVTQESAANKRDSKS